MPKSAQVRSREELNQAHETLQNRIEDSRWCAYAALVSMGVVWLGLFLASKYLCIVGGLGMISFGGYCTSLSENMKDLKTEWKMRVKKFT